MRLPRPWQRVELKSAAEVEAMRRAGLVVAHALDAAAAAVRPGVTTAELDLIAERTIRAHGATPSFLGYQGFPASLCVSVCEEVVHGIPGDRVLADGDLVSLDCGAVLDGWHGDAAVTVPVGEVSARAAALVAATAASLWRGIAAARTGARLGDISHAVQRHLETSGDHGIVEDFVGHGIGTRLHQPPDVPNVGTPGRGRRLAPGLVLAIEPMVTWGSPSCVTLEDQWTVVTSDGSWAAHAEHTVALTEAGPWVLTAHDGGRAALTALGAPCGAR